MLIEVGQMERRYSVEARSHSGTPVFRNETLSPKPQAQGESEKYLSSLPQPFPGPYLVAFQEWRPQLALGLPEVRTCFQCKAPSPYGDKLSHAFYGFIPFPVYPVYGYAPSSSSSFFSPVNTFFS